MKDSPADKAGIIADDEVLSIGSVKIQSPEEFIAYFKSHPAELSQIRILRGSKETTINITPKDGKIGSYVGYKTIDLNTNFEYKYPLGQAMVVGAQEVYNQSVLTLELFGSLVRKLVAPVNPGERKEAQESLSGPIGIGNLFVDLARSHASVSVVLLIAALISINLGVFNLLPFPALDGGRFAFLTIETIVRKIS
ncbi:MAG: site-2 protease family protein [Patescibacteria group bacterium]